MRQIAITGVSLLVCCFSSSEAWAQACKPDVSREDKISHAPTDIWMQVLFSTSFASNLVNTSEVGITATVGRYGSLNAVNLQIEKREESATNAQFESAYRAAVGKPFYFGFKTGDPVAFVVTQVSNEAKVQQGFIAPTKGVTTVVLSAVVQDKDLARLRDALTSRQINAVRILLAGDVRIEKSVDDKNGKKMMEKFSCFYQSLDARKIDLSAGASTQRQPVPVASVGAGNASAGGSAALVQGRYLKRGSSDLIELSPDGKFLVLEGGRSVGGTYTASGDVLTLTSPQLRGPAKARFAGDTLTDADGVIWERQGQLQKPAAQVTIDQITQMVTAKLPDDIIITTIRNSGSKFDLTPEALIKLKTAGASDAVIRAMEP